MRNGTSITLAEGDRHRLETIAADRNTARKHVWRARIVLLSAHGPAPHRWRRFKLSNDPAFAEKLHAVVGLHVAPPAHAAVLGVDEKSRIQALYRTQPGLPLKKGRGTTMTHNYMRHGTTTLFAALNVLTGEVFGWNMQRHRHQAFIRVLNALEREIPAGEVMHATLDDHAAHKHAEVRAWLARHPRWSFHFTPTSSSRLNALEGVFAKPSRRRLKHGVFCSVVDLQAAINRFVAEHDERPKPFVWRAGPAAMIAARSRGFQAVEAIQERPLSAFAGFAALGSEPPSGEARHLGMGPMKGRPP